MTRIWWYLKMPQNKPIDNIHKQISLNILHNDTRDIKLPPMNMLYSISPHTLAPGNSCKQLYQARITLVQLYQGSLWCNYIWTLFQNVRPQNREFVRWTLQLYPICIAMVSSVQCNGTIDIVYIDVL